MLLAILQARTSSTRLPGKVLKPILGRPMLALQIERLQRSRRIDKLIVATSTNSSDDPIEILCRDSGIDCYRGDMQDVLDRFYQSSKQYQPAHVVRLTGDCPLADPDVLDQVVRFYLEGGYDHACNVCDPPSFPDGLDVEVFRFSALEQAWNEARLPSEREHVSPFIKKHPELFKLGCYRNDVDLSPLRWTVDEPEDFDLVRIIYEALYPVNSGFTTDDILRLLEERPELKTMNTHHQPNAGYAKSLMEDEAFLNKP